MAMRLPLLIRNVCSIQFAEAGTAENLNIGKMEINGTFTDILFLQKNQR